MQAHFNPINYGFEWTEDGWYKFDSKAAHIAAKSARDAKAKELKADGYSVKKSSQSGCLMTRGGIGSGHPQIETFVTAYMVEW